MPASQLFFYALLGLILLVYLRRKLLARGIPQYDAATVAAQMKNREGLLLLDVRSSQERSRGHIPGSTHIALHQLKSRLPEIEKFRDKEIVCYCMSGSRSLAAASILRKNGFRSANLSGGISSWPAGV